MAWWQKKLLRYALSRTGLLDDEALDLDNLDITLGKKNVVELKGVGLNIKRISKLAQLPPSLRVETARVLSLRLSVPADIYQSSIVAEVDGVELSLRLEDGGDTGPPREQKSRPRSPVTARSPQHRKTHRRLRSPPPYDAGLLSESEDRIPTTESLAKSFLLEEPVQERRELEASVAANTRGLEESIVSESSEGDDLGTGATIGLPGFLAGFLQGVVDRLQVSVKNVGAKLETEVKGDGQQPIPVTIRLHIGEADLQSVLSGGNGAESREGAMENRRQISMRDISLDLISDAAIFSELSEIASHSSPTQSRQPQRSSTSHASLGGEKAIASSPLSAASKTSHPVGSSSTSERALSSPKSPDAMRASALTADHDRFADAGEEDIPATLQSSHSDLDIQPGDDNISWGSRRSKSDAPPEDLWNSLASEDDLPDSLLLVRASTPRAHSSRNQSPALERTRRGVSPYARSLQSPGSWPRMDESPQRHRAQQSPGSWPTLDQSQHSMFQSMTADAELSNSGAIDNKHTALETSISRLRTGTPPEEPSEPVEDLTVSRVFTHQEAKSLYMSAMSNSPKMHVPGGWSDYVPSERSSSPEDSRRPLPKPAVSTSEPDKNFDDDLAYGERPFSIPVAPLSGNVTPRPRSPELVGSERIHPEEAAEASRQLLFIDSVLLLLPIDRDVTGEQGSAPIPAHSMSTSFATQGIPGTFSAYSERSSARRKHPSFVREGSSSGIWTTPAKPREDVHSQPLGIEIGAIKCQVDIPSARLLYKLALKAMASLQNPEKSIMDRRKPATSRSENSMSLSLSIDNLRVALKESADRSLGIEDDHEASADNIVTLNCRGIYLLSNTDETDLRIGSFKTFLGTSCLLSFDRSRNINTSMVISEQTPDIALLTSSRKSAVKRPITEVTLETLPLDVLFDLTVVDDVFSSFGGLSGVLEIGNSILSESGLGSTPSSPSKPNKGVRFHGDPEFIDASSELKINARIGGIDAKLQGTSCSVQLRTTTVKAIYREQGAVATIEQLLLAGPYVIREDDAPLSVDLSTLRVEYLFSPQDKDLERLLSLLTPSKDKYDNDDDILIDTLLRQRKKGAVARASLNSVKLKCDDWSCLSTLSTLGNEMGKLSAVAKYLPEDERPGLLILVRVKDLEAQLPVNERFGKLQVKVVDFHCAHVGLPALLALSVGNVEASDARGFELVHPLVVLVGSENLPMVMARMLGDEVEPTIKVKLFNACIEYSVPTILGLTGLDEEADLEDIVVKMAQSVADLAFADLNNGPPKTSPASDASGSLTKRMNVNVLVHDSAIGLTPQKCPSKGLFVLTDARLSSMVPPEDTFTATVELRKAALFVTDQVSSGSPEEIAPLRNAPNNTTTRPKVAIALSKQGYVLVGSIMSATIVVRIEEVKESQTKSVDVNVKNELLLLETCADSTQTLLEIFNGLVPPAPPSKQPKYLTEPMTIEDMMASFTGDAFAKPDQPPTTLFDVEEEPSDDGDSLLDALALGEEDDGLLAQSEMTSSLYGPVGSMLYDLDKPVEDDPSDDFPETAESLLEDDPFEMPSSPTDAPLSDDSLARELKKQCKPAARDDAVDLGLYEIEDLGFDALGGNQRVLGTQHRFNTPMARRQKSPAATSNAALPFRLQLRDLHIIWNIYDGYDWQKTRDGIADAVEQVETRIEQRKAKRRQSHNEREDEESVIGDFLFNSIYIGVPSNQDAQDLRRQINRNIDDLASETESIPVSGPTAYSASGRPLKQRQRRRLKLERSKAHKIAFELKGVSADVLVFPPDSKDVVSSVDVRVKDFEIFDNVPTSTWKKFLTHLDNLASDREMSKPMMHIELLNVRTLEKFAASEIVLHVSVLPIRLHVDQDALDFITRFFEFKPDGANSASSASEQPFLQRVEVDTVDMCLDYKPKRVDYAGLRSGHTTEFKNFVILDAANIRLKHAIIYGIKGFEPLHQTLNDVWLPDIKRNQLPTVLAGLAPVRSLVNIGSGVRDVVAIPIREYRKDGRIVRSIQKGAFQFGKTTASELARLGAKVAIGTQNLLSGAEGLLAPASASPSGRNSASGRRSSNQDWNELGSDDEEHETRAISAYANQPLGIFSGLRSARRYLEHDLLTARDALIAVQGEVLESSSPSSAAAAVVKHAPTLILRPIIGTSRAVGTALLGVGNQIDRGNVRRIEDKYKKR